jgi:NTE family protein
VEAAVGLALGSGSARGIAHIGVLKAFNEAQIPIKMVSGTSIGALVGAAYCAGKLNEFEQFMLQVDWKLIASYCDFVFPKKGLMQGQKVRELIAELIGVESFSNLSTPLLVASTDLHSGDPIILQEGNLVEAVRASISLPGIFEPVLWQGRTLVDGGLTNPVPVRLLQDFDLQVLVAVDLNSNIEVRNRGKKRLKSLRKSTTRHKNADSWAFVQLEEQYKKLQKQLTNRFPQLSELKAKVKVEEPGFFDVISNSINIMMHQLAMHQLNQQSVDVIVRPLVSDVGLFDYDEASRLIQAGYEEAQLYIPIIQRKLDAS